MEHDTLHRQQGLYWSKMVDLKIAASYMRRYRDHLGRWVKTVGTIRAVASSTSIAAWAIWRQYAFIWGAIIACTQVLDAVRDIFPVAKRHKAASELVISLETLFIDAQLEWENIFAGKYTDDQIAKRLHTLRLLHHKAEQHSFSEGIPKQMSRFVLAESDADDFFRKTYGVNSTGGGRSNERQEIRLP
jgi:hypothetical protein